MEAAPEVYGSRKTSLPPMTNPRSADSISTYDALNCSVRSEITVRVESSLAADVLDVPSISAATPASDINTM